MLFALLALATPSIGPPPNVGPLKPEVELEPELELEDDDPGEFEFSSASEELPEEGLPEDGLPESPLAGVWAAELPGC